MTLKENSEKKLLFIQKIIYYIDLSGNLRSLDRLNQSKNRTVWLTEERTIIRIDDEIRHVNIWLKDSPEPIIMIIKLEKFYTHIVTD